MNDAFGPRPVPGRSGRAPRMGRTPPQRSSGRPACCAPGRRAVRECGLVTEIKACLQAVLCLALLVVPFTARTLAAVSRPNIVVILADDLGWGDLRCYNPDSKIPTPHLDRLAAEGLRFNDAHTPSAVCSPTRYGLLTGRYAWRTRLRKGVLWGYSPPLIEPDRPTVASVLRDHGYTTAAVGKWHLGLTWATREPAEFGDDSKPAADPGLVDFTQPLRSGPLDLGFDHFFGIPASLDMDPYVYIANRRVVAPPTARIEGSKHQRQGGGGFWREGPAPPGFHPDQVLPTLAAEAGSFLRHQPTNRPFFLYLPLTAPHDPWVPTADFRGRSGAGDYGDFVTQVDATVGGILRILEERGLAQHTLVVFTSDNGAHWPPADIQRWDHRANGPWRGMKSDAFEGGHRVPFLVRWPARIKPGGTTEALVCLTDLLATFAEINDIRLPPGAGEDSRSFASVLRDPRRGGRNDLVHHSIQGVFAVRRGSWKLIEANGSGGWTSAKVETPAQLYDLASDPSETRNHFDDQPGIVRELRAALEATRRP